MGKSTAGRLTEISYRDEGAAFRGGFVMALGAPAIAIGASFLGFGTLVKESGLTVWHGLLSTATGWALPGQVALVELYALGSGLLVIGLAVLASATRLLPMVLTLMPYLRAPEVPRWRYYLAAHYIAVTGWAVTMRVGPQLPVPQRLPFFMGFVLTLWVVTLICTAVGYLLPDILPREVSLALVFVNPLYFLLLFLEDFTGRRRQASLAIGAVLGPLFFMLDRDWSLLLTGLVGGSLAFFLIGKEKRR